jgi:hypothetical protein
MSFQWSRNGTPVPDATNATYSAVAQVALAGTYSSAITNPYGGTNSASADLIVLPAPAGYGSAVLADNPIAYWRLGETNGTVAHDYVGGNDGTYYSATLGVPGYSVIDPDTAASLAA